jgi:hypothetical protein
LLILGAVIVLVSGIPFMPGVSASSEMRTGILLGLTALGAVTFACLQFKTRPKLARSRIRHTTARWTFEGSSRCN